MEIATEYRAVARHIRTMAAEPLHYSLRQRLLEVVRELEREADIHTTKQPDAGKLMSLPET